MSNPKNLILPEHNSSRLIFVDNENVELFIEDTTDSQYCDDKDDFYLNNFWHLGKLSNKIWLLEDVGIYDSNHEHKAKIYYIDPITNEEVILYNVKRIFEYGQECDRLYTEHSGGMKMLMLDKESSSKANLYIKYDRFLPGAFERVFKETKDGEIVDYVVFYKYNEENNIVINEVLAITHILNVTTDKVDNNGNPILMEGIETADITINTVDVDFSRISIVFSITENNTNDIKVGIVGINSINKKFISPYILEDRIEPCYFVVQPPKNRSWICYRTVIGQYFGISLNQEINDSCYLNRKGGSLNGYKGIYDMMTNTFNYEILIDNSQNDFFIEIPQIFTDYVNIEYYNNIDRKLSENDLLGIRYKPFNVYNELDGMHYLVIGFKKDANIKKIVLKY